MSNIIKVKRGTDSARAGANTLQDYELHYSHTNESGVGRPERLWVADSTADAGRTNNGDLLVGPFEFVEGPSGKIRVTANYQSGKVEIDWREPSTFNPTMSGTFRAVNYSNNAVLEAGDAFNNVTNGHSFTITTVDAATELAVDWGTYEYTLVGGSAVSGSFPAPIDAQDDGDTISGGTASTRSITQTVPTPATFKLSDPATRRQSFTINARTSTADGNLLDTQTFNANFGWRVRGFISETLFASPGPLPSPANIIAGSKFHYIAQTPTTPTSHNTTKFLLPNDGGQYHLYLVHTCGQNNVGTASADEYGWTPSLIETNSAGVTIAPNYPLEVTDYAGGDVVIGSIGGTSNTALGNQNDKAYRVWRLTASPVPGEGQTYYFIIS